MKERPILFSGPMVRAILDGRKTQTRRIVNPLLFIETDPDAPPGQGHVEQSDPRFGSFATTSARCPYGVPGDRLWVRETIRRAPSWGGRDYATYAADGAYTLLDTWPWKAAYLPSIHCPRGLSRIDLEVTGVRVERLQAISEEDARSEGVELGDVARVANAASAIPSVTHRQAFSSLWDSINANRAPWSSNPWVWVVSFKRVTP